MSRTNLQSASIVLLGTQLTWRSPPSDWIEQADRGAIGILEHISKGTEVYRHRQKRGDVNFCDAMTCLLQADPHGVFRHVPERGQAQSLAFMIEKRQLDEFHREELNASELYRGVRCHLAHRSGSSKKARIDQLERGTPQNPVYWPAGTWTELGPGFYRQLILDMTDLERDPAKIDWARAAVLATLVQMRSRVEVFLESGYWGVSRCSRQRCQGFFKVKRANLWPRFCSSTCRACAPREQ